MYCCIVFVTLLVQDKNIKSWFTDSEFSKIIYVCQVIEMVILIIFISEICIKIYAFGFRVKNFSQISFFINFKKKYFSDKWLIADALIIFLSIVLATLDLFWEDSVFGNVSKVIRGFFRFLRIFLIFRKVFLVIFS